MGEEEEDRTPGGESTVTVKGLSKLLEVPPVDGTTSISTSQQKANDDETGTTVMKEEDVKPEASQAIMGLLQLGLASSFRSQQSIEELDNEPRPIVKKRPVETSADESSSISADVHQDGLGECLPGQSSSLIDKSSKEQIGESSPVKEEIRAAEPQGEPREMKLNSGQLNISPAPAASPATAVDSSPSQPAKKKKRNKDQNGKDSGSAGLEWSLPKAYVRRTMKLITSENILLSRDVPPFVAQATEKFLSWFVSTCVDELKEKEPNVKTLKVSYGDVSDTISNGGGKLSFLSFIVPPPMP